MNPLDELQAWYERQCNDHWEHQYGVKIDTLDNPGWMMAIDLVGTAMESEPFEKVEQLEPERDWFTCSREGAVFKAAGGPNQLRKLVEVFNSWVARVDARSERA